MAHVYVKNNCAHDIGLPVLDVHDEAIPRGIPKGQMRKIDKSLWDKISQNEMMKIWLDTKVGRTDSSMLEVVASPRSADVVATSNATGDTASKRKKKGEEATVSVEGG